MGRVTFLFVFALVAAMGQNAQAQENTSRYILTGSDRAALKTQIENLGGKVLYPLRYQIGWIAELTSAQRQKLQSSLALRSQHSLTMGGGPESAEIFEKDEEVHLIDAMQPAVVWTDPTLGTAQKTPWGIKAVHAPDAYSLARGNSVTVCIVDTGIQKNHPDLEGSVVGGENTLSDRWEDASSYDDDQGHGTHVAGTIAARDNGIGVVGVAPEASLFVVKALNAHGSGNFSTVAEGIRSCIAHHAQVINLSLGTKDDSLTIRKAIADAIHQGIVVVAAAGNSHGPVEFPANVPGVLAVSALSKEMQITYFSCRGPEVAFSAPGEEILSTYPGGRYAMLEGTSQAAPHVAGVAALLFSAGVKNVTEHLQGRDLSLSHNLQGAGCIDAIQSLHSSD